MLYYLVLVAVVALLHDVQVSNGQNVPVIGTQFKARWCTISDAEQAKCEDIKKTLAEIVAEKVEPPETLKKIPLFFCVRGKDVFDCMLQVENNEADLITLDSGQGYFAGRYHNMMPLYAESYSDDPQEPLKYYAVAVVKASSNINVNNLRGTRSCHTGIGRSAGWVYPMGTMISNGIINTQECNAVVKSVSSFFSKLCLPGALNSFYNPFGNNPVKVCESCGGVGAEWCSSDDPFAGYDGSFKCMAYDVGDVAWVRDNTVAEMTKSGSRFSANDFKLLCPSGNTAGLQDYINCNWGHIPSHIIMTSGIKEPSELEDYREFLNIMAGWFKPSGPYYTRMKLFESEKYSDYDRANLLFTDGTRNLVDVGARNSYYTWVDDDFRTMLRNLNHCPVRIARWCVLSEEEKDKCEDMLMAFRAKDLRPDLDCVLGGNTDDCMKMIRSGDADMMTLDAGDIFFGGKNYGLIPIISEDYGDMTGAFHVVAAARKPDAYLTLFNLKGKRSCHGGVRTGDGWFTPASILMETTQIRPTECNIYQNMGELFARSCIPGVLEISYNPSQKPINLCEACAAGGFRKCQRNNLELYYKATGAFRCLVENAGDVAFVRHNTIRINTDGRNAAIWARNRRSDDYEIMCKDGSRKAIDQWPTCNLGRVPSNAIVTGRHKSAQEREIYWNLLNYAQQFFSSDSDSDFGMFNSGVNRNDLVFTDAAVRLLRVSEEKQNYLTYLGVDFLSMVDKVDTFTCASGRTVHSNTATTLVLFMLAFLKLVL